MWIYAGPIQIQLLPALASAPFRGPNTVARVVLFGDAAGIPAGGPLVEVCAFVKTDLTTGEVLDDHGMYMSYGEAVNGVKIAP
jgi:predicted homoserine dehydrogenase-like protein